MTAKMTCPHCGRTTSMEFVAYEHYTFDVQHTVECGNRLCRREFAATIARDLTVTTQAIAAAPELVSA